MATRYAAKQLAAVEVQPTASNQHEFNGGTLRKALGFDAEKVTGPLTFLFYRDDSGRAEVDSSEYTLYDSRRRQTHRGPEYRLYYKSSAVERYAAPGDLLVVHRRPRSLALTAIVARAGTATERELRRALELGDEKVLQRFVEVQPGAHTAPAAGLLGLMPAERGPLSDVESHPIYLEAVRQRHVPAPKVLAYGGRSLAASRHGDRLDPDDYIFLSAEAETELFFAIERAIKGERLALLASKGAAAFDEVIAEAISIQQSRRSRRGLSLQDHFAALLERERIPYTAQCRTEGKETPDFIVPGQAEYRDPAFPSERLRMVACKTTLKERWRQVLTEAARIPEKYLLTLDDEMSRDVVESMRRERLRVFVPRRVIKATYPPDCPVETVTSLVEELRAVVRS